MRNAGRNVPPGGDPEESKMAAGGTLIGTETRATGGLLQRQRQVNKGRKGAMCMKHIKAGQICNMEMLESSRFNSYIFCISCIYVY